MPEQNQKTRSVLWRFAFTAACAGGVLLILSLISSAALHDARAVADQVAGHDAEILRLAHETLNTFHEMRLAEQGWTTHDDVAFLSVFHQEQAHLKITLDRLREAVDDQPGPRDRLLVVFQKLQQHARLSARRRDLRFEPGGELAVEYRALTEQEELLLPEIGAELATVAGEQMQSAVSQLKETSRRLSRAAWVVLGTLFVALVGLLLTYLIGREVARRVVRLSREIDDIRGALSPQRPAPGAQGAGRWPGRDRPAGADVQRAARARERARRGAAAELRADEGGDRGAGVAAVAHQRGGGGDRSGGAAGAGAERGGDAVAGAGAGGAADLGLPGGARSRAGRDVPAVVGRAVGGFAAAGALAGSDADAAGGRRGGAEADVQAACARGDGRAGAGDAGAAGRDGGGRARAAGGGAARADGGDRSAAGEPGRVPGVPV